VQLFEFIAMASGPSAADLDQYRWERLPNMPTPRCYTVGAYHEGKIYVIGKAGGCVWLEGEREADSF